jgi:hypothetical protein
MNNEAIETPLICYSLREWAAEHPEAAEIFKAID